MVTISCFYNHFNSISVNIIFIQFEKFVKVILNNRIVILTNKELISNIKLFQLFKLSLLCTEDTSRINQTAYGFIQSISTQQYWKKSYFCQYYNIAVIKKQQHRNPLLAQEPNRSSSSKKIRKFEKLFSIYITYKIKDPNELLNEYLQLELAELNNYFTKYIEYNKNNAKIQLLSSILHNYGRDVYSSVRKFM